MPTRSISFDIGKSASQVTENKSIFETHRVGEPAG